MRWEKAFSRLWRARRTIGESIYDIVRTVHSQRADPEHLFVLIAFGDVLGVPIIPRC